METPHGPRKEKNAKTSGKMPRTLPRFPPGGQRTFPGKPPDFMGISSPRRPAARRMPPRFEKWPYLSPPGFPNRERRSESFSGAFSNESRGRAGRVCGAEPGHVSRSGTAVARIISGLRFLRLPFVPLSLMRIHEVYLLNPGCTNAKLFSVLPNAGLLGPRTSCPMDFDHRFGSPALLKMFRPP